VVTITDLSFQNNVPKSTVLEITNTVGELNFENSTFKNENIHSGTDYIQIGNPYIIYMRNITFEDISDDRSSTDDTTILDIKSIDISTPGDINITQISLENCTITFLKFSSFSGSTSIKKNVKFDYVK